MSLQRSGQDGQRLACPRCKANNFVGQAQCWQCRAPLSAGGAPQTSRPAPPPKPSPAAPAPSRPAAPRRPQEALVAHPPSRPVMLGVLAGVALLAFALVLRFANSPQAAPS